MAHEHDELAMKRGWSAAEPSDTDGSELTVPAAAQFTQVERDASAPDVLDMRAAARDVVATARDAAAEVRDADAVGTGGDEAELSRALAARDRVASDLDRREAALDRTSAADHLRGTYRDTLTGALRRDPGREELGREVDRAHRTKSPLVVAFLDVVRLKRVNDEQGHSAGDRVLSAVGVALRGGLRSYDRVVRYGGDEFVCALPGADLTDAARRFDEVGEMLGLASPGARISIGLVELQTDESLDGVIDRADRRLYEGRKVEAAGRAGDPARG